MPNNVHTYIRSHLSSPDLSIGLRAAWQKAAYHLQRCSCPGAKIALDSTLYKPSIKRYYSRYRDKKGVDTPSKTRDVYNH